MSLSDKDYSNELKISTMTYWITPNFELNLEQLFEFFPCIESSNPIVKALNLKKVKKINVPHFPDRAGQIISIRFEDAYRGILKNKSATKMKNAISMHISLKDKNVAVKIYTSGIHLTGIKYESNITEVMDYLILYIKGVYSNIAYLYNNIEETKKVYNYILENISETEGILSFKNVLPVELDSNVYNILTRDISEFTEISHYLKVVQYMIKQKPCNLPLETKYETSILMFNYNYELGFDVNLNSFVFNLDQYQKINTNPKYKFTIIYDNSLDHHIKLQVPYTRETNSNIREKKTQSKHTFMIYKKFGRITQSGPKPELMLDLYNYFRNVVEYLKPKIDNSVIYRDSTESEQEPTIKSKFEKLFDEFSSDSDSEIESVNERSSSSCSSSNNSSYNVKQTKIKEAIVKDDSIQDSKVKPSTDSFVKYIMKFNNSNLQQ